jgi:hypothetical protein
MNKEKLTWEAPLLLLVDVHATFGGASVDNAEDTALNWFPSSN